MARSRYLSRRSALAVFAGAPVALAALHGAALAQSAPQAEGQVDMDRLMEPGPLPEMIKGDPDAPVTIIEYASMTCGHCASFHNNTWPALEEKICRDRPGAPHRARISVRSARRSGFHAGAMRAQ